MKRRVKFANGLTVVSMVALLVLSGAIRATANDDKIDPTNTLLNQLTAAREKSVGLLWLLTGGNIPGSWISTRSILSTTDPKPTSDDILCSSTTQAECAPRPLSLLSARSVLGKCLSATEFSCIEAVRIGKSKESAQDATFISYIGKETVFEENKSLEIPRGSSVSRWKAADGEEYLVLSEMLTNNQSVSDSWKFQQSLFSLSVERIGQNASPVPPTYEVRGVPNSEFKTVAGSRPEVTYKQHLTDTYIEMTLRLPNSLSGWFTARIADGNVSSRAASASSSSYTIGGHVARVYVAGKVVPTGSLPAGFMEKSCGKDFSGSVTACGGMIGVSPVIKTYESWLPYIGDQALSTLNEWGVRAVSWSLNNCFKGGTGLAGLLATNAAIYDPVPPTWNESNKALDFTVSSPHIDENGTQAVGTYTLSLPSRTVSCLYNKQKLPAFAIVSVTSAADGTTYSAVNTLSDSGGWVNFSAKGFHYSTPTIRVAFADKTPRIVATSVKISAANRQLLVQLSTSTKGVRITAKALSASGKRVGLSCKYSGLRATCKSSKVASGTWRVTVHPSSDATDVITRSVQIR